MPSNLPRPPYDPELVPALAQLPWPATITIEMLRAIRADPNLFPARPEIAEIIGDRPISHTERLIPGLNPDDADVTVSIFGPKSESTVPRPCIYYIHGGGQILLDRFAYIDWALKLIPETDAVVVSVEYRLAPENPAPAGVNDCYAGLKWVSTHAVELGVDLERIMIAGPSGGAGLAAGTALMCRDQNEVRLCAQYLGCPMLDDRNVTLSSKQYVDEGTWSRGSNEMAWNAILGSKAGSDKVSIYIAPGRAEDLSGLPNTFIDVGSAEVFRDESVAFASRLWAAGVQADLHVYGGGCHGFDMLVPEGRLAMTAQSVQAQWVKNVLQRKTKKADVASGAPSSQEALPL